MYPLRTPHPTGPHSPPLHSNLHTQTHSDLIEKRVACFKAKPMIIILKLPSRCRTGHCLTKSRLLGAFIPDTWSVPSFCWWMQLITVISRSFKLHAKILFTESLIPSLSLSHFRSLSFPLSPSGSSPHKDNGLITWRIRYYSILSYYNLSFE